MKHPFLLSTILASTFLLIACDTLHHVLEDERPPRSIGVVTLDVIGHGDTLRFYNPDGSLFLSFAPFFHHGIDPLDVPEDFQPLHFHPDYFIFAARAYSLRNDSAVVLLHEAKQLFRTVDLSDGLLTFLSWEDYLAAAFNLGVMPLRTPPHEEPDEASPLVPVHTTSELKALPVRMEGDWLLVRWAADEYPLYDAGSVSAWREGWVRWRTPADVLLIEIYLMC